MPDTLMLATANSEQADVDGGGRIDFSEFEAAVSQEGNEVFDGGLQSLVKRVARANVRDAATGRLFLLVFLLYASTKHRSAETALAS